MAFSLLIGGQLVSTRETMDVINPATEQVLAKCPVASRTQLDDAVAAAKHAFAAWSETPIGRRKDAVRAVSDIIKNNAAELARLLTQEQGKPLGDATREVMGAAMFFRNFTNMELPTRNVNSEGRKVELHRRPLGVVGAIVPWNFPLVLMAMKVAPALIMGNTVVLKPAPSTPLSTLKLGELIRGALPPGVINVIAGTNDLGAWLTAHPDVRKISFTGSTATGAKVMQGAASTLKRITLELGGNDAAIVLDDVDPKETAPKLFQGAFANNGQICIGIKRLYVHDKIYDAMCDELANLAKGAVVGDGLAQGTQLGPMQNKSQYERVLKIIAEAKGQGKVIAGDRPFTGPGYFIYPTIVRDIAEGTELVDGEQFGPVLPVIRYTDPDDAVARANASPYGLGASIWCAEPDRAYELARRVEAGTVWVNKHADMALEIPFGGAKQSGIGAELAEEGLAEFTQLQVINMAS